jgi:hypothetical protein
MKPEIEITVDELEVATLRVTFNGSHLDTIQLSKYEMEALAAYFAEQVAA